MHILPPLLLHFCVHQRHRPFGYHLLVYPTQRNAVNDTKSHQEKPSPDLYITDVAFEPLRDTCSKGAEGV